MPRASRAQQAIHHEEILEQAARLVREFGPDGVSVPDLMAAAGLTHGGFYKHFRSKADLVAQATSTAFRSRADTTARLRADDPATARDRFVETYLSPQHRDTPGRGCPTAALAGDVARRDPGDPLRTSYLDGVHDMVQTLTDLDDGDREAALVDLSTLVGAVLLARATSGDPVSEELLRAVREHLRRPGPTAR